MKRTKGLIGPAELESILEENPRARLLDVRMPGEFETAHIHGAYNVPLDSLSEHADEIRVGVEDPIVLVCQSGMRARRAEEALQGLGMPHLHVLDEGMSGWIGAGYPVVRGRQRLSLERQVRIGAGSMILIAGILTVVVNPMFGIVAAAMGGGLLFAGISNYCAMATVLKYLPYNQASCDVNAMVRALKSGEPAPKSSRSTEVVRVERCQAV